MRMKNGAPSHLRLSTEEQINVLMVDDNPAKLLSYEVILSPLGENLIKAHSGREALDHLLRTDVAVILMDVSMPELDGFQLAAMIRQHPRFQHTAVIFISGVHMTDVDRLKGYEHGGVDYVSIPVIPEILRAKVKIFAELRRKTRQLEMLNAEMQKLSSAMIKLRDEERRRIARELHDGLGQELAVAKMTIAGIQDADDLSAAKQKAAELDSNIDSVIKQVRSMSHLLHPPLLDEVGLYSALQTYAEGLTSRSGINTTIEVEPIDFPRLSPDLEIAIFRIVQEALTNVFRHSGARTAKVSLAAERERLVINVRDDGKGIPEQIQRFHGGSIGVGLSGMRQRIKDFGGELLLQNANPGTSLTTIIPRGTAGLLTTDQSQTMTA